MSKADAITEIERIAWNRDQGAAALGIDKACMGALIRVGGVPHILIGSRVLIGKQALEQWLTTECLANVHATHAADEPIAIGPTQPARRRKANGSSI